MNDARAAFDRLLSVCERVISDTDLQQFQKFPTNLVWQSSDHVPCPAIDDIRANLPDASGQNAALRGAFLGILNHAEWRRSYTQAQVGPEMMARYGYLELYGPTGHYLASEGRAYLGYWGSHLNYARHWHEAEELYYVAAGSAEFETDEGKVWRREGEVQEHSSNQPHAMRTGEQPILTFVLWRGAGMEGLPYMPEGDE